MKKKKSNHHYINPRMLETKKKPRLDVSISSQKLDAKKIYQDD